MYQSSMLDSTLEKLCEFTTQMFDTALVSEVKMTVTTVITALNALVLLTNYKHIERLDADYKYMHHDAETLNKKLLMWQ
ncbi:hypothetical protein EMCG_07614 [[Emmonsia] crescens]|uniref:Uncharacterized protein n=1 Tax=[Emmonsia] crescens TaxID=73230 RepID=A0A0G2JB18_9EURO|nr:hypothetical protein EMCG_07614 [Emmonsia crescens UAMH 3008]